MSGIPSWARFGAKVVCVRDFSGARTVNDNGYRDHPQMRQVYVVAGSRHYPEYKASVLFLEGFPGAHGFDADGFKPAVTLETDIATHFRQHLDVRDPVEA